ncbi:MAG: transglycosylase domain-containing protein [Leptospirales bacterium]
MAENFILTLMIKVLAFPFVTLSRIAEAFDFWNIRTDIGRCLNVIDSSSDIIPPLFIVGLIAAEDRRNALHPGVDPIAMVRAGLVRIRHKKVEGASTIEQQFVRTVSGRYKRSLQRSLRTCPDGCASGMPLKTCVTRAICNRPQTPILSRPTIRYGDPQCQDRKSTQIR